MLGQIEVTAYIDVRSRASVKIRSAFEATLCTAAVRASWQLMNHPSAIDDNARKFSAPPAKDGKERGQRG
jgi:hypothetical protein